MRQFDRLLQLLSLGTLILAAVSLAATEWWIFELATHFRTQYVVIQAILLALLVLRARWHWCLALLPVIALNAAPLAPYWPRPGEASAAPSLTLMSANLNGRNTDYSRFIDLVEAESTDLLLLVEFNSGWHAASHQLRSSYPYRIEIPRDDLFGIALFSRVPFLHQQSLQLQTTTAVDVRVSVAGRPVRVLGVHLRPPVSAGWAEERNRQLAELAIIAQQETGPLVVMGDFNVTPYSPIFTTTLAASGLRDTGRSRGWGFSWPSFLPILGVPIDLCMVNEQVIAVAHRRGPEFGSDHYPVIATVALR